jgi:ABC-type Mn2+/Zn2+ transport system ATPase subunit
VGTFEVDLFPEEVNGVDHPKAKEFKKVLEAVAADFQCTLLSFEVDRGTVSFVFDSDELNAEILRVLEAK